MTCPTTDFVFGTTIDAPMPAPIVTARPRPSAPQSATNPLERLAQLMLSNERLMDELATSRARITDAREYFDRPGANARFGEAHLDRCRVKHSAILAQLRANRIEALHLLGQEVSGD